MKSEIEFREELGRFIRSLRQNHKDSIETLSGNCEMDYSSLNNIENGKRTPSSYNLYKILFALDVDLIQILTQSESISSDMQRKIYHKLRMMSEEELSTFYMLLNKFHITNRKKSKI